MIFRVSRSEELYQVEDLEAIRAQQPDEIAGAHVELDTGIVIGPLEAMHAALGTLQCLGDPARVGHADHRQRRVAKKDELSPTPQ